MAEVKSEGVIYRKNEIVGSGDFLQIHAPVTSWVARSKIDCARGCSDMGDNCDAVEYDEQFGSCTAGDRVITVNGVAPYPTTTVFYSVYNGTGTGNDQDPYPALTEPVTTPPLTGPAKTCVENLGFIYDEENGVSACIFVSDAEITNADAEAKCLARNANLYMIKSIEKFTIFKRNRRESDKVVWVGLRDTTGNNTFQWVDGEDFLPTDPVWGQIWNTPAGQPDDGADQLCVASQQGVFLLNDFNCYSSMRARYACEIDTT